jgi:hypothetical protein
MVAASDPDAGTDGSRFHVRQTRGAELMSSLSSGTRVGGKVALAATLAVGELRSRSLASEPDSNVHRALEGRPEKTGSSDAQESIHPDTTVSRRGDRLRGDLRDAGIARGDSRRRRAERRWRGHWPESPGVRHRDLPGRRDDARLARDRALQMGGILPPGSLSQGRLVVWQAGRAHQHGLGPGRHLRGPADLVGRAGEAFDGLSHEVRDEDGDQVPQQAREDLRAAEEREARGEVRHQAGVVQDQGAGARAHARARRVRRVAAWSHELPAEPRDPVAWRAGAADAVAKTAAEGFPRGTVVFLDIERMDATPTAMRDYYKEWVARVLADGRFTPGIYAQVHNAPLIYRDVKSVCEAAGRTDDPPFWVAGGRNFSPTKLPQDVGHAFAAVWQGILDVVQDWNGHKVKIDVNVAQSPSPSLHRVEAD